MENNYCKEFELKQHTPLIHFQHDQEGATLRASEFKPKLQKYLKDKSNFQMSIFSDGIERNKIKSSSAKKLYFGNIPFMIYNKKNIVRFRSFNKNILNEIEDKLSTLLAFENFGCRQNKGFGSFYLKKQNYEEDIISIFKKNNLKSIYYFDVKKTPELFLDIFYLYQTIKSGINEDFYNWQSDEYSKSILWQYFKENEGVNWIWEKRLFKKIISGTFNISNEIHDKNIKFIRPLLGLAPEYTFIKKNNIRMDPDYEKGKHKTIEIMEDNKFIISHDEIKRFPSPITFKPIEKSNGNGFRVYIILKPEFYEDDGKKIQGNAFNITRRTRSNGDSNPFSLKVPEDFKLNDFFCYVSKLINDQSEAKFVNKFVKNIRIHNIDGKPVS